MHCLPLSWQAGHDGIDIYTLGTRVCSHTLHHPYSARAFGNPPAVSHVCKYKISAHTHTYTHIAAANPSASLHFSLSPVLALLWQPPPTALSGRNQWALSSAECDVMQIFAVTNPEGEVHVVQQAWVRACPVHNHSLTWVPKMLNHWGNKREGIDSVHSGETKKLRKSSHMKRKERREESKIQQGWV